MLSQALLNSIAAQATALLGQLMEPVTYYAKSGPTAVVTVYELDKVRFELYAAQKIGFPIANDPQAILKEDRQMRVEFTLVTWTPTLFDEVVRTDGSRWRVISFTYGSKQPWYLFQMRRVA
jgi:hypothetical protein